MSKTANVRRSRRAEIREARLAIARHRAAENATLLRLAGEIRSIARAERSADQLQDHVRRVEAWKRLAAVRMEARRVGLVDEVEHLIRSMQRGDAGGPSLRTHGAVLRRWQ